MPRGINAPPSASPWGMGMRGCRGRRGRVDVPRRSRVVSWTLEFFLAIHEEVGPEGLLLNKKKGLVPYRAYGALISIRGTSR